MKKRYLDELLEYFNYKSTMEILGVDRDENAHSKFLAWLFEKPDTRNVAVMNLLLLLKYKKECDQKKEHYPEHLIKLLNKDSFQIYDVKVILEDIVEVNGAYGRADIVIEVLYNKDKHLYIIIENKIDSFEHRMGKGKEWQTAAYYTFYKNKYHEDNCLFAYLTRPQINLNIPEELKKQFKDGHKDGRPQCDNFIWINYQDVLDKVLNAIITDTGIIRKETKNRVEDYIRCLGINKYQDNLMAVSNSLEELAESAWKEIQNNKGESLKDYQALIQPMFEVLYYIRKKNKKKNNSKGTDDRIETIYKIISGKDYTTYTIKKGKEIAFYNLKKNALVKRTVELYIEEKGDGKLKEDFSPMLRMVNKGTSASKDSLSNQVVIRLDDYISQKNIYRKSKNLELLTKESAPSIIKNDDDWEELKNGWYVIQTGWDGRPMMNNFIMHAEHLIPDCRFEECIKDKKLEGIVKLIANS